MSTQMNMCIQACGMQVTCECMCLWKAEDLRCHSDLVFLDRVSGWWQLAD